MKIVLIVLMCLMFTAVGIGTGYFGSPKIAAAISKGDPPPADAGHEHAAAKLSPQALANLGVTLIEANTRSYSRTRAIPATAAEMPNGKVILYAPVSGRIVEVLVQPGSVVAAGKPVVRILRDPYPGPELALTEPLIKPSTEELHRAILDLRKAIKLREVTKLEIERVEKYAGINSDTAPILAKKTLIDLRYELAKSEQEVSALEQELGRHGLTAPDISAIEAGKPPPQLGKELWKRAFEQNGLWSEPVGKMLETLPAEIRDLPWTIAAVVELFASGRMTAELSAWIGGTPDAKAHFMEVAGMIQRGHTLADLRAMVAAHGFDSTVELAAPAGSAEDWDIGILNARQGQRIEKGSEVAVFETHRRMLLKAEPQGSEMSLILKALDAQSKFDAVPLVAESGPMLKDLVVLKIEGCEKAQGIAALIPAGNSEQARRTEGAAEYRTWQLRPGQRFLVKIPVQFFKEVYVLPADAVTDDGADKVVLIQNGDSFEAKKVIVLYQDSDEAVLDAKNSELFPGDVVVQHGAFGLNLALKGGGGEPAEEGGTEPPGHHHHHHH